MTNRQESSVELYEAVRLERLRASIMSLVCGLLALFALSVATRLPDYLSVSDHGRLSGAILFRLLVAAGLVDNIRTHVRLRALASNRKMR